MNEEIENWTPFNSTLETLPNIWKTTIQNLLTEGNQLINNNPSFSESQPITALLIAVMEANDDFTLKKCSPLKIVPKEVRFDTDYSRFVYTNKFGRNTILKPNQVRQCINGSLQGHISGCPIKKENLKTYLETLSNEEKVSMNDLLNNPNLT